MASYRPARPPESADSLAAQAAHGCTDGGGMSSPPPPQAGPAAAAAAALGAAAAAMAAAATSGSEVGQRPPPGIGRGREGGDGVGSSDGGLRADAGGGGGNRDGGQYGSGSRGDGGGGSAARTAPDLAAGQRRPKRACTVNPVLEELRRLRTPLEVVSGVDIGEGPVSFEIFPPYTDELGRQPYPNRLGITWRDKFDEVNTFLAEPFDDKDDVQDCVFRASKPRYRECLVAGLYGKHGATLCAAVVRACRAKGGAEQHLQITYQVTHSDMRKRGLGRLLVMLLLRVAAAKEYRYFTVIVADGEAPKYWKQLGFGPASKGDAAAHSVVTAISYANPQWVLKMDGVEEASLAVGEAVEKVVERFGQTRAAGGGGDGGGAGGGAAAAAATTAPNQPGAGEDAGGGRGTTARPGCHTRQPPGPVPRAPAKRCPGALPETHKAKKRKLLKPASGLAARKASGRDPQETHSEEEAEDAAPPATAAEARRAEAKADADAAAAVCEGATRGQERRAQLSRPTMTSSAAARGRRGHGPRGAAHVVRGVRSKHQVSREAVAAAMARARRYREPQHGPDGGGKGGGGGSGSSLIRGQSGGGGDSGGDTSAAPAAVRQPGATGGAEQAGVADVDAEEYEIGRVTQTVIDEGRLNVKSQIDFFAPVLHLMERVRGKGGRGHKRLQLRVPPGRPGLVLWQGVKEWRLLGLKAYGPVLGQRIIISVRAGVYSVALCGGGRSDPPRGRNDGDATAGPGGAAATAAAGAAAFGESDGAQARATAAAAAAAGTVAPAASARQRAEGGGAQAAAGLADAGAANAPAVAAVTTAVLQPAQPHDPHEQQQEQQQEHPHCRDQQQQQQEQEWRDEAAAWAHDYDEQLTDPRVGPLVDLGRSPTAVSADGRPRGTPPRCASETAGAAAQRLQRVAVVATAAAAALNRVYVSTRALEEDSPGAASVGRAAVAVGPSRGPIGAVGPQAAPQQERQGQSLPSTDARDRRLEALMGDFFTALSQSDDPAKLMEKALSSMKTMQAVSDTEPQRAASGL